MPVLVVAGALVAALAGTAGAAAGAAPDSGGAAPHFGRGDAVFGVAAVAAIGLVSTRDLRFTRQAHADRSRFALDLAADARRFGEPAVIAPVLLATDGLARLTGHAALGAATERIALSTAVAGVCTLTLKELIGRERPDESSTSSTVFHPFSRHDAFPSGHSTFAFALASSISAESRSRWVPAVLYPVAALTAWSRVRDARHWPSDVVAGAAIGGWVGHATDVRARHGLPHGLLVLVWPRARGAGASARLAF